MVGSSHYRWYQSQSLTLVWGSVPFGPVQGVCEFGPAIPWNTTMILCLHEGCLSHPISDKGESSLHYISMGSSQSSKRVLKP